MSAKNKLMLIQYCNVIITWSLDPATPILGSRNDPTPYFLHKVTYKKLKNFCKTTCELVFYEC